MVATVTGTRETEARTKKDIGLGPAPPAGNGSRKNGGRGGGGNQGGGGDEGPGLSPERYRLGVLIGIASILMMFTALASAYVVRSGLPTSTDWRPMEMPGALVLSTALILASSATMTLALRAAGRGDARAYGRWLTLTLALGLGFLASQVWAWRQLVGQGVYLASNPHSSFFYVLTGLHAIHLLGGILALSYLRLRAGSLWADAAALRRGRALAGAVSIYWHFMDALWVVLFVLLFFWR